MDPEQEKTPPPPRTRKEKIRSQVLLIAGYEEILRMAMVEGDLSFQRSIEDMKQKAYKELKELVYYGTPQ